MAKHQKEYEHEIVSCGKCGFPVSTRVAWFDPYNNKMYLTKGSKGCYVHFACLSKKRRDEVVVKNQ